MVPCLKGENDTSLKIIKDGCNIIHAGNIEVSFMQSWLFIVDFFYIIDVDTDDTFSDHMLGHAA